MATDSFVATMVDPEDDVWGYEDKHSTTDTSSYSRIHAHESPATRTGAGMRWRIPAGKLPPNSSVVITEAKIRGWIYQTYDDIAADIFLEAVDDAAAFSSSRGPYHAIGGSVSVPWVQNNYGPDATQFDSPDFKAAFQEWVDRPTFVGPGAYCGVLIRGRNQAGPQFRCRSANVLAQPQFFPQLLVSYEYTPNELVPGEAIIVDGFTDSSVTISWSDSNGGTNPVVAQLQRSLHGADTWADVAGGNASPFVDNTVDAFTHYDYRVKWTDSAGTPAVVYSDVVDVHTDDTWVEVAGQTSSPGTASGLAPTTEYELRVQYTDEDTPAVDVYSFPLIVETDQAAQVASSVRNRESFGHRPRIDSISNKEQLHVL